MKKEYRSLKIALWLILVVFFAVVFAAFWLVFLALPVRA